MPEQRQMRIGGPMTPVVKKLLIINIAVYLIQEIVSLGAPGLFSYYLGLSYDGLFRHFFIWQLFTYMFLHGGMLHIFFNLFTLWMFGGELEQSWGSKYFLRYYIIAGIGAGVCIALMNAVTTFQHPQMASASTIGASGAIFALLLAYGVMWPNREVMLYFLVPIKMKYMVLFFGLIEFIGMISDARSVGNVSHIGHVGGILAGAVILFFSGYLSFSKTKRVFPKKGFSPFARLFKKFRMQRQRHIINERIQAKEIIDTLLEKIAREGINSLTPEEKSRLEWARRRYYSENETLH